MTAITAVLVALGVLMVLVLWKRKKEGKAAEPDYRALFVMGIVFLPVGLVSMIMYFLSDIPFVIAVPFLSLGLTYLIAGLANRDKWKARG
jgi:cytochrome c oxidase assembly factor CtaG